jgi:inner membrane protein
MKNPLLRKLLMILGLTLLLCIPLRMVGVTVWERSSTRDAVKTDIANSMAGEQWVAGPVLVLPYFERVVTRHKDASGVESETAEWVERSKIWLPRTLTLQGALQNTPRRRGIYEAQLYQSDLQVQASFDLRRDPMPEESDSLDWGSPYLALGIGDVRGISEMPRGTLNGDALAFEASPRLGAFGSGVHAPVLVSQGERLDVKLDIVLKGMERLDFLPIGGETTIVLASNWPHPSFQGRYLPDHSEIGKDGFRARWSTTFLATGMEKLFGDCINNGGAEACAPFMQNVMGVKLIKPVDIYLQSERALKYGFLFVGLAFAVFFFFEVLKGLRIHPMQYLLVGFALTIFFLLVVALSEHVAFVLAYGVASGACISLLAFYVSFVLKSFWRGLGFASLMTVLFGVLYALLQAEDYALLMGSLLLFGVLAIVMILTRRLDWFAIGDAPAASAPGMPAR